MRSRFSALSGEGVVQWGNRTRSYLDGSMAIAEATGDADKIFEQVIIVRLLKVTG